MRASEWQFLCAVHESPKSCCAIDYSCHTLDWATNIVTSQKIFPSRLSLGAGDATDDRGAGVKHLVNIFRRLHRIFAHAWFQHRGVFWQVEGQTGLYVLFKTVCDTYELLPAENYKLPPEAEGLDPQEDEKSTTTTAPSLLKPDNGSLKPASLGEEGYMSPSRTNTRRHIRQSPSVGSAVTTVLEAEEEDQDAKQGVREIKITEEEMEAEVPVIVESYETNEPQVPVIKETPAESEPKPEPKESEESKSERDDEATTEPTAQEEKPSNTEPASEPASELSEKEPQEPATKSEEEESGLPAQDAKSEDTSEAPKNDIESASEPTETGKEEKKETVEEEES